MTNTMGYLIADLTPQQLKKIFESAQYECEYMNENDPIGVYVKDLSGMYVISREKSNLISFFADRLSRKDLESTRAYCRSVHDSCYVVRAVPADEPDGDGGILVTFEYDFLLYPEDRISARKIIKIARDVAGYIAHAIRECDSDSIFKRSRGEIMH